MSDIKQIIAKNISDLRIDKKMTQLELAEILNYSDKAVSKWERAESIPDVVTLKAVADIFGVTVDYIITEHTPDEKPPVTKNAKNNHLTITWISVVAVWLLGTCAYTFGWLFDTHLWMAYIVCIPVSAIVLLVFNSIWGRRIFNMYIISTLLWSTFLAIFLGVFVYLNKNIWMLFLIGIPAEVVIFLCFRIKSAAPSEANRFVETVKKRIRHSKKDQ
jgi:transcriptional regulator with XRE-family HTH domain